MLEKITRMNLLYDFYGMLLTPKQCTFMELYYLDDLSLAEIAEQYQVSRQAVHDNIRRSEGQLEEYEQKLGLLARFENRIRLRDEVVEKIKKLPLVQSTKEDLIYDIQLLTEDGKIE